MLILSSAAAAILPMSLYLFFIWRFDRYDREPVLLLLRNYLWGAVGAIFFSIIGSGILSFAASVVISNDSILQNIETILIAPLVEEFTKGIFLLITIAGRKFDNMTDGIVYGGAIGLGFGMTENFMYFITFGDTLQNWIMIVIIRTLFSAVMHGVSTATLGAFLGYAKFRDFKFKFLAAVAGFSVSVFIHFCWNLFVSFDTTAILGFIFIIISVIVIFIVFALAVAGEKKIIYNELSEEVRSGLIPANHLPILNSSRRNKLGWIDENIRSLYITAATTLAFRKMQFKNSTGKHKQNAMQEIEYYRSYIQNLLSSSGFTR
jgi:protease PrsW